MSKVAIVYLSTSGNTKAMAEAIAEGLESRNVESEVMSFYEAKVDEISNAVLMKSIGDR